MELTTAVETSPPEVYGYAYAWPWLRFWLFYLVVTGALTHLVVAWLGCTRLARCLLSLNSPRISTKAKKGAEKTPQPSEEDLWEEHQPSEEERWEEPWDMDQRDKFGALVESI